MLAFPECILLTYVLSRAPPCFYHQLENSFIAIQSMIMHIEVKFSFSLRFQELLDPNRVLRRLLDDEIHRALSLFIGHGFLRFAVSAYSYDVNQSIESLVSVSDSCFSPCLCFSEGRKLFINLRSLSLQEPVLFTHMLTRAPPCFN